MKKISAVRTISMVMLIIFAAGITPDQAISSEKITPPAKSQKKADEAVKDNKVKKAAPDPKKAEKEKKQKARDLANDKIALEKITTTLDYGIQKDRKEAINLVHLIKDETIRKKAMTKVISLIDKDSDIEIRKTAATVAGDLKAKEAVPALINALDDDSEDVQIAASYALKKLKAVESKGKMIELVKKQDLSENSNLTDSLIITLGEFKATELIKFAEDAIKDNKSSTMVRERFILFIGQTGSSAQKDFLINLYSDEEEDITIRSYAVKSIGSLKIKEAKDGVRKVVDEINTYSFKKRSKYYSLYMNSIATLVKLGDPDSVSLLMNSIRSNSSSVRLKAVNLIKEFDDQRTIDILKYKMKNDSSKAVRNAAKKALKDKGIDVEDKGSDSKKKEGSKETADDDKR